MKAVNPATGELLRDYPEHAQHDVAARLDQAREAQRQWARMGFAKRSERMRRAADVLERDKETFALLMANEMGKPVGAGRAEVDKCAWVCRYYAGRAEDFLADELIEADAARSLVAYQPLGVVLAVMPWNFPFWQVFRFAAPGLMAGNAALLKHASNVPGCALAIEQVFTDAGMPPGLFATLLIGQDRVGEVIADERVAAVTLTGSVPAGRAVAAAAGKSIKKSVLELGGSDPYLVLEDADLDLAVAKCAESRLINGGQSCIAAKRFLVVPPVLRAFEDRLRERFAEVRMGSPLDEGTDLGPMARVDLRDEVHGQVRASMDAGARCVLGGAVPGGPGAFYPPTILADVGQGMPAYEDEVFGPVAAIIEVADEGRAIAVANASSFGLGAAVFTRDVERGERVARQLEAGCCFVNDFVRSDPRLPFGGVKLSGYGRELSSHGIREFVNVKTISVA